MPRKPARSSDSGGRRPTGKTDSLLRTWILCFAIALGVSLILYGGALRNPFVSDDKEIVGGNQTLAQAGPAAALRIWTIDYWSEIDAEGRVHPITPDRNLYRPATIGSFWLNARLTGVNPPGMRFGNLLLHAGAASLVGLLSFLWLGPPAGIVATLAVALHPVGTDVVNRVVGRSDILVLLWSALFLVLQWRGFRSGWTWASTAIAFLAAFLAFASKESGLMLVPIAIVQWWLLGRDGVHTYGDSRKRGILGLVGIGGAAIAYLAIRLAVVGMPRYVPDARMELIENPLVGSSFGERLPAALSLAFHYLRFLIVPWPLLTLDVPAAVPSWSDPTVWLGAIVLGGAVGLLVMLARRRHMLSVAVVWWLAAYLIVGQLFVPIGAYREVRFAYPFLGAIGLLAAWAWTKRERTSPGARPLNVAAALLLVIAWGSMIFLRNRDFSSETKLFEKDRERHPDRPATQVILGTLYLTEGRTAEAGRAKEEAVRLAPTSGQALSDLGAYYAMTGDTKKALDYINRSLARNPDNSEALTNLATLRLRSKNYVEARDLLVRAEKLAPESAIVQLNLALVESMQGERDAAVRRLRSLLARDPGNPNALTLLREISR